MWPELRCSPVTGQKMAGVTAVAPSTTRVATTRVRISRGVHVRQLSRLRQAYGGPNNVSDAGFLMCFASRHRLPENTSQCPGMHSYVL